MKTPQTMKPTKSPKLTKPARRAIRSLAALAAALTCAWAALSPLSASAAEGTRGFSLALDAHRSHIGADDPTASSPDDALFVDEVGSGGSLSLGWGFTPTFTLRLVMSGSRHETTRDDVDLRLTAITLEAVHYFQPGRPLRPYVFGGLGGFRGESEDDPFTWESEGGAVVFGAGLAYFLSRDFAFTFTARGEAINWDKTTATLALPGGGTLVSEQPVDEGGLAGKFAVGMGWWF